MVELDVAALAAANDAWVWEPDGSEVVETGEFRLVLFPERFPEGLQAQRVRSARPAAAVVADLVALAAGFGRPEVTVTARFGAPAGLDEELLRRGAVPLDTADVLARPLPADVEAPSPPGLEVRWRTTTELARDADAVGVAVFGGDPAPDEEIAREAAADREALAAGTGGAVVAYVDGAPAGFGGVEIVDGVARLWGGGVLEEYRRRGVYRAMLAARLAYSAERGAGMALTRGRIATSSPILRRLGFASYGTERSYRLPLA